MSSKPQNPFYAVLIVVGVAFVLTACCYFVMTVQSREVSLGRGAEAGDGEFAELVNRHGFAALMIELVILAAATFAAIGTDDYWTRQATAQNTADDDPQDAILDEHDHVARGEPPQESPS